MEYRKGLPVRPARIAALPLNEKGYPVPWFVECIDGKPDFRVMSGIKWSLAVQHKRCWICGQQMTNNLTFVAGPMCGINRTSGEPPSHYGCAVYAAISCPFLTLPNAVRREAGLPEQASQPAGIMLERNPGVTMLWITDSYKLFKVENGVLIQMGEPKKVEWYAQTRQATRAEVEESIATGLPFLEKIAADESHEATLQLIRITKEFQRWLPKE